MSDFAVILIDYDGEITHSFGTFLSREQARQWCEEGLKLKDIEYSYYNILELRCPWPDLQP